MESRSRKPEAGFWIIFYIWDMRLLISLFTICFLLFGSACNKDDDDDSNNPQTPAADEYYVRYELESSSVYIGGKLDVSISTEKTPSLDLVVNTRTDWETIIGPVQRGFRTNIDVSKSGSNDNTLKLATRIFVSKNGSPFALKAIDGSDVNRQSVSLSYTIDY